MRSWIRSTTTSIAFALAAMLLSPQQARAGCPSNGLAVSPRVTPAMYFHDGADEFIRTDFEEDRAPITGLWKVTFTAKGNPSDGPPDGALIDSGFVTWHADGTELMNSGRAPPTGSFCMGVWKRVGESTYRLNHWGLSWDSTGTTFVGPANIRETVTLDRNGKHYWGTFSITQYAPDGTTVLGGVVGVVSATRITVE
jgi:hypothetical protein